MAKMYDFYLRSGQVVSLELKSLELKSFNIKRNGYGIPVAAEIISSSSTILQHVNFDQMDVVVERMKKERCEKAPVLEGELNRLNKALEEIMNITKGSEAYTEAAKAHFVARMARYGERKQ
ncbi:hypothetical protein [Paenibacillus agilis]|uniref:Uncharacterized protein n=1 Tax=Paenibacillus agilis TaxID=3020863 RepID=A0A559IZI2_9BACL|nr:hypothetical protein [Paenibacillus agilis]TVX93030.1 hypothetical protein FPZ44_08145 [Paenibacillus agilis]